MQIVRKILPVGRFVESVVGDLWLNVNTRGAVYFDQKRGKNQDALYFDTLAHTAIRKVIQLIQPARGDVVMVLGCGKGRAVCHFARQQVRKVIGIEISEQLCEMARANVRRMRKAFSPIEIRHADAALTDLSEGTIFFMFNPFGEQTLRDVLVNIEESHDLAVDPVTMVYMNAQHAHVFHKFSWFEVAHDYQCASGQRVIIYRNSLITVH